MEHNLEGTEIFYEHDASCSKTNFTELNERGLKTCLECAGVFDELGNGVQVDGKIFDANWTPPTTP